MASIDLNELSARERLRVEWKKNVADIDQVIKTIVAFANDISNLGGGYVVCGAEEGTDKHGFQKVYYSGLIASRLKELEGKVLRHCREKVSPPIVPVTEEIPVDGKRRILVFIVSASGNAHSYSLLRELADVEDMIVIGSKADALKRLEEILEKDPSNSRALNLLHKIND